MLRTAAIVVALALVGCGASTPARDRPAHDPKRAAAVHGVSSLSSRFNGIEQHGPVLGSPGAPFTLVEFADLQCPFCARFDRDVLPAVIDEFVRPGRLKLELRPLAFLGPESAPAGAATVAAGQQDRMWQFADLFYRNQGAENSGYVTRAFIDRLAVAAGVDLARLRRDSKAKGVIDVVIANGRSAQTARIIGTPGFRLGRTGGVLTPFEGRGLSRADMLRRLRRLVGG